MIKIDPDKAFEESTRLFSELQDYKAAAVILYDALQDLVELGATVAICGIEPGVMRALEDARKGHEIVSQTGVEVVDLPPIGDVEEG